MLAFSPNFNRNKNNFNFNFTVLKMKNKNRNLRFSLHLCVLSWQPNTKSPSYFSILNP